MPEKAEIDEVGSFAFSPEMARVLADRWRSRILMEISVRPLSPSQFVETFGGNLSDISRCFRQLADWDFIEIADILTGGDRRGAVEHLYRRVRRALFDTSVWESLPLAYRVECSGSAVESYIGRVSEAFAAGTFDEELDRHLSWDVAALDRIAWGELTTRLDQVLYSLPDLAAEAISRMAETGEEAIPTTIGLSAFRSPALAVVNRPRLNSDEPPTPGPLVITASMAKALANKWRSRILMEMRLRPLSRKQFVEEVGGNYRSISRYFSQLEEWKFIEVVDTQTGGKRRGGSEQFFGLKRRAHFDTATWEQLPRFLREECSASFLHGYFARVSEAIEAETFDAEIDRHFSWDGAALDRHAWTQLTTVADTVLAWLPELEAEAARRIAETGEEPIPTTLGLAAFRSPKGPRT